MSTNLNFKSMVNSSGQVQIFVLWSSSKYWRIPGGKSSILRNFEEEIEIQTRRRLISKPLPDAPTILSNGLGFI